MSDKYQVGRIEFGGDSQKLGTGGELSKALQKLRNPAPGVTLVSHGWVPMCAICEKSRVHAKWHEASKGELINPISLLEFIDTLEPTEGVKRIQGWIKFITQIEWPELTGGNQAGTQEHAASTAASEAL